MPPTPKAKTPEPEPEGQVFDIPEERKDLGPEWQRAFQYAMNKGNTVKASVLWADGHSEDPEYAS